MSLATLSQQLSELADTLKQTNALINRLAKLSFQPGSEPPEGESTVRKELSEDIHDSLKQLEEDLELLKQEAEDLSAGQSGHRRRESEVDRERARLSGQLARLGEDLRHSRSSFRRAQLTAKRNAEAAKQKERELAFASLQQSASEPASGTNTPDLFAGRRRGPQQQKQQNKDEVLVSASSDVTAALRRTHDLLSTELSRSRFAQETFDQSTAALAELGEKYSSLNDVLSKSGQLLRTLVQSQKSDTWYLETTLRILLATLIWLAFRRLLYGPFFKLPLFLFRIFAFLLNWLVLKPFWLFLSITGIITTQKRAPNVSLAASSASRPPLVVHNSAKRGSIPTFSPEMQEGMPKGGVPAGAGGAGAKVGKDEELQGQMSEAIGKMTDESKKAAEGQAEKKEPERRADGTVLEERGDVPRNPKKKMFKADVEDERQASRRRDEL